MGFKKNIFNGGFGFTRRVTPIQFLAKRCNLISAHKLPSIDAVLYDKVNPGHSRESYIGRVLVGDGTMYAEWASYPSESLTYYDNTTKAEVITTTDANGRFIIPTNGVVYMVLDGERWDAFEEIQSITDGSQAVNIYSREHNLTMTLYLTHSAYVEEDLTIDSTANLHGVIYAKALGKNLVNISGLEVGSLGTSGEELVNSDYRRSTFVEVSASQAYILSNLTYSTFNGIYLYDSNFDFIVRSAGSGLTRTATTTSATKYIRILFYTVNVDLEQSDKCQLELGTSATTYEAWEGYWKDASLTEPYSDGQLITAYYDPTLGKYTNYAKAYITGGVRPQFSGTERGEISRNYIITDSGGTIDPSGTGLDTEYLKWQYQYPKIVQADTTLVTVDSSGDAKVLLIGDLLNVNNSQIFYDTLTGTLKKDLFFEEALTGDCLVKAMLSSETGEYAVDSDGVRAVDSEGNLCIAPKI